jgi:hypothetical protein
MVQPVPFDMSENEETLRVLGKMDELGKALEERLPRFWAEKNVRNETGQTLSFVDRPWQKQIYDDVHPQIAIRKAAQVGATSCALVRAFHRQQSRQRR